MLMQEQVCILYRSPSESEGHGKDDMKDYGIEKMCNKLKSIWKMPVVE